MVKPDPPKYHVTFSSVRFYPTLTASENVKTENLKERFRDLILSKFIILKAKQFQANAKSKWYLTNQETLSLKRNHLLTLSNLKLEVLFVTFVLSDMNRPN